MMIHKNKSVLSAKYLWGLTCGALVMMTIIIGLMPATSRADTPLPPRPGADLPPRPDVPPPAPPAVFETAGQDKPGPPPGAHIELSGLPRIGAYWTMVQWQDRQGNWHNVDGWQGTPDNGGKKWWVAAKDFGTGPFRWVVFGGQNGPEMGHSDNFLLPPFARQTVQVSINITP